MSDSETPQSGALRNPNLDRVAEMNLDGASDRPRGSIAGSHRGSVAGSHRGSVSGSQAGSPTKASASGKTSGFNVKPLGHDSARIESKPLRPVDIVGKRVDLPADAYLEVFP